MDALWKDISFGARALLRNRWYTAIVVVTLGLGIGANTAIFSVITGVLLRPLPYAAGDRLVLVRQSAPLAGVASVVVSIKEYFTYREQARDLEGLVEYHQMTFDLLKRGEPDRVSTGVVSHNFFDLLGIRPIHGRAFVAADDRPGAEAVLLLGYSYWTSRFGADPSVVGQIFEMNGRPHTVVGILPNVPMFPQENDVYMPVLACPFRAGAEQNVAQNPRIFSALTVFGRLRQGIDRDRAATEVAGISARFAAADTRAYRPDRGFAATLLDVREQMTQNARPMLMILLGTTGLVLLLACANVANLTLARLLRRDRELAVRAALGAGRSRLFRQLLTESLLLALAGGVAGVAFALLTLEMMTRFVGRFTQRTQEIAIDPWVLAFTLLLSIGAGVLFGAVPALMAPADSNDRLRQGGKGTNVGAPRGRLQSAFFEVGVPPGDLNYYKLQYVHQWFWPVYGNWVYMLRGDFGYGDGYGGKPLPFFRAFYAGGSGSVRGYEASSLGPRDEFGNVLGGKRKIVGNTELFYPILKGDKSVRASLFVDAGQIYVNGAQGDNEAFRYTTGVGVSWNSPIGPLKFSYAVPLNEKPGDRIQKFQFQVGSVF